MKKIVPEALGGTLFIPATHKNLLAVACEEKFPMLRSAVFDLEDGIGDDGVVPGLQRISHMLANIRPGRLLRFIRPRNPEMLERLFEMPNVDRIDGFVLPKFGLDNAGDFLKAIEKGPEAKAIMPAIEGIELFDAVKLRKVREVLLPYRDRIPLVRFGAEDMLRQLGMRRECDQSLFDLALPSRVIADLLAAFKPYGIEVSGPVYRCFSDAEGFEDEVRRDLREGLIGKTIIHPSQIEPIERLYRVGREELEQAAALFQSKQAVLNLHGSMAEHTTQSPWAERILKRAELYGVA